MNITRIPGPQLGKLSRQEPPKGPDGPEGPSNKEIFLEGSKVGLVQFGVPAMVGLLIPSHPYIGGALAGAAVVTARAGGFHRENLGATLSGALIGALAGHASARFGLTGALAAAGLGALAVGAQAVKQSLENGH